MDQLLTFQAFINTSQSSPTMKVLNIHKRIIHQPKAKVLELLNTLASPNDLVWPKEQWPAMRLDAGLQEGSKGGHGPIGYSISQYIPGKLIVFQFSKPKGFDGIHQFEVIDLGDEQTELVHTIDIKASGIGILSWVLAIRWLHDALVEDAFDKVENYFSEEKKRTEWNSWVKLLRGILPTPKRSASIKPSEPYPKESTSG